MVTAPPLWHTERKFLICSRPSARSLETTANESAETTEPVQFRAPHGRRNLAETSWGFPGIGIRGRSARAALDANMTDVKIHRPCYWLMKPPWKLGEVRTNSYTIKPEQLRRPPDLDGFGPPLTNVCISTRWPPLIKTVTPQRKSKQPWMVV